MGERFEILSELGRGGGGVVYLASDRRRGQKVALKVIPSTCVPSPNQFQEEFSLLSGIHEPSIAEVYDFGFDPKEKNYYLAQEYFDGTPLSAHSGKIDFASLAAIAARLGQALQCLHQRGIFHGDLKPSNVLVRFATGKAGLLSSNGGENPDSPPPYPPIGVTSPQNAEKLQTENLVKGIEVKLVDFGLARRFASFELSDSVSGTIPYMAPELFVGGTIDGRSDLYSLGATLYEAIGGQTPFQAVNIRDLIECHLFATPTNPVTGGSSFPQEFGFLVLKLLNKDPRDRFEEANDLIRALNLRFHLDFPLGPEKAVLTPQQKERLKKKRLLGLEEQAIRFYEGREDPESRRLLAELHYRQGQWAEAEKLLEGLTDVRSEILKLQLGIKKGAFEKVREGADRLLQTRLEPVRKGAVFNVLGTAFYYLGRFEGSEEAFQKASEIYERCNEIGSRASLLNNLANLKIRDGKWHEALALYQESIALCRARGDVVNEGLFLMSLGYAHHMKENYEEALSFYRRSEALLEAISYRVGLAKVKANLANLFITTGSLEKGEERLRQAQEIAGEKGDKYLIAYTEVLVGDLLSRQGKETEALEFYKRGKAHFQEIKAPYEEVVDRNIQEVLEGEGRKTMSTAPTMNPSTRIEEVRLPFIKTILAINRRLSLLQNLDEILKTILDAAIELTHAERGYLILKEEGEHRIKTSRNVEHAATAEKSFSASLVDRVMGTGEPIVTLDAMTDERFSLSLSVHKLKLRSVIGLPLRIREAIIGAIYLDNRLQKDAFSEATIELLQAFADQAAIAIANAEAFDELKRTAGELRRTKDEVDELNQRLSAALSETKMELHQLKNTLARNQSALELKYRYDEIIGRSPSMMEALKIMDRIVESRVPVFILGESGTGKELIARAIHFNGPWAKGPFVPVNCSAIPETLLEAELFGYVRGAFTGADRDREGLFEMANGGTLFLDEIGDMPLPMQAKLLRVLQDKEVRRIGSKGLVRVEIRVVSASNKDLKLLVKEHQFREDLFFRLHGVSVSLPPLRNRSEDLPILVDHFLEKFAKEHRTKKKEISRGAFDLLLGYSWPGNVRELENTVYNACLLAEGPKILPKDLRQKTDLLRSRNPSPTAPEGEEWSLRGAVDEFEKGVVSRVLEECHGNITRASQKLQVDRSQLSRLVKRYQLKTA